MSPILAAKTPVKSIELRVPWVGCFEARVFGVDKRLTGDVEIDWRGWKFTGTVDETRAGEFVKQPGVVIVGGLSWRTVLEPKTYQNDRGNLRSTIAAELAAAVGQRVEVSNDASVGRYWATRRTSAGASLSRLIGPWHFDFDGITRNTTRSATLGTSVRVLRFEQLTGAAHLFADRPDQCLLGATLSADNRLPAPRIITELFATAIDGNESIVVYTKAVA